MLTIVGRLEECADGGIYNLPPAVSLNPGAELISLFPDSLCCVPLKRDENLFKQLFFPVVFAESMRDFFWHQYLRFWTREPICGRMIFGDDIKMTLSRKKKNVFSFAAWIVWEYLTDWSIFKPQSLNTDTIFSLKGEIKGSAEFRTL